MVYKTYQKNGWSPDKSALVALLNSKSFSIGSFATEATVNIPDRVEIYSNTDYE